MKALLVFVMVFGSLLATAETKVLKGKAQILYTEVASHGSSAFSYKEFVGKRISFKIAVTTDEAGKKSMKLLRMRQPELRGYGPVWDSVDDCIEEKDECIELDFQELNSHWASNATSISMTFGNGGDEYTQFFTLAGLKDIKNGKIVVKGAGRVKDIKYDHGTYYHTIRFELKEQ